MRIQNIGQTQKKTITGEFIGIDSMIETDRDAISPEAGDIALVDVDLEFHDNSRRQRLMHLRSAIRTFADHFMGFFVSGANLISTLKFATEGTFTSIIGASGTPGVIQMNTGLPLGTRSIMALGQTVNAGYASYYDTREIGAIVNIPTPSNAFYVPIGASANRTIAPTNTVYFRFTNGDTNFQAVAVQGGIATVIDTGIAPVGGQFRSFRIRMNMIEIRYYIDDILVASIPSTMVLGTMLNPGCFVQNLLAGTARTMQVDHFYIDFLPG